MSKEEFPHEKDLEDEVTSDKAPKKDPKAASKEEVEEGPAKGYEEEIAELSAKNKNLEDKYLRSEAEIRSMQARYAEGRARLIKYESQSLVKGISPVVDNLERTLAAKVDDEVARQLQKGVQMTPDSLVKPMKDQGITEIKAEGETFDPALYQAVQAAATENDDQKDHIIKVLQKGYQYKGRTLRPVTVVVTQ